MGYKNALFSGIFRIPAVQAPQFFGFCSSIPVSVIPNGNSGHSDAYDGFKYPHLQLRNVSFDVRRGRKYDRLLDAVSFEVRGGEILAVMATKGKTCLNSYFN